MTCQGKDTSRDPEQKAAGGFGRRFGAVTARIALLAAVLALATVLVSLLSRLRPPFPPSDDLLLDAARAYVAWIVEDRAIPGWNEQYPDASFMKDRRRFYVVCDAVSLDVKLSKDLRVVRIPSARLKETFEREGYGGNAYLWIGVSSSTDNEVVLGTHVSFGQLASQTYEIRFWRDPVLGLRAQGKFVGGS